MPNTYSQISIQVVFAVKGRENILSEKWRSDLFKYISGIITGKGQIALAVNGWKDHVHTFFGLEPSVAISDVVRDIKSNSSKWINDNHFVKGKFQWQSGFGAFSYSRSQRDDVINYIARQEQHHATKTFKEEYLEMLKRAEIKFSDEYLFEFYDWGEDKRHRRDIMVAKLW